MTSAAPFGPVRKIRWLTGAAGRGELSRAELATLIVLADHVNSDTGKAWPAYPRIAATAGVTVRTAKRAIARLTALKLVTIAEHGGPGRSNRYGLNWPLFEATGDGDTCDTMQPAMVTPMTTDGDTGGTDMVPRLTPNPINPSEQQAKDEIDRSQADGASAAAPLGACGLSPAGKGYAAFWAAWGSRVTVADTERLIDAAIDAGANLADIVAGAERFQRYCTDTGKPARMTPAAFVKGQKWRDDWQLVRNPKAEPEKPKAKAGKGKGSTSKAAQPEKRKRAGKPVWENNPAESDWSERHTLELARLMKRNGITRVSSDTDIDWARNALEPWMKANPRPPYWRNRLTGERWGKVGDGRPADDWRPPATERKG